MARLEAARLGWLSLRESFLRTRVRLVASLPRKGVIKIATPNLFLRRPLTISAAVAALVLLAGICPVAAQQQAAPGWSDVPMKPGDMVRLHVWRDPELNGDYPIDENGMVMLPLIGPRPATSKPANELRNALVQDLLKELNNQDPVVTLLRRVRVLGEVRSPGIYHIDPTMTLGDVVAMAQGATASGRLTDIRIVRGGAQIYSDLDTTLPVVQAVTSGDQIMVPKSRWLSRNGAWLLGGFLSAGAIVGASLLSRN